MCLKAPATREDVEKGAALIVAAARKQRDEIEAMPEGQRPAWCIRNVFSGGGGGKR